MQAIFETLFDIVYLISVITLGILMIRGSKGRKQYFLYGALAVILGALIVVLFYRSAKAAQDKSFQLLWLAIVLSFGCYIPVVLFADTVPEVGMLMIPKTCAYVWAVVIGYRAMKENQ